MNSRLDAALFEACARFPNAVALEDTAGGLSYAQLAAAARETAAALHREGIAANEPVLVAVANAPNDIGAFLGVWAAGGVAVPVARTAPAAATQATRAATGARLLVAGRGVVSRLADAPPPNRPLLKDAAFILFTSGSTGAPKGVVLSHAAFVPKLAEINNVLGFSADTRALLVLQIIFVFGIWYALLALLNGGRVFMSPRFDPLATMAEVAERGVTDAAFVPTMLRRLVAADEAALSPLLARVKLARIHTGGEPFSAVLGQRLRAILPQVTVIDIYGLTETCTSNFFNVTAPAQPFTGAIGHVARKDRFRIADTDGRELPAGDVGELQIATPFIMNGYLDRPDLTHAALAGDFFRTGDLARVRADGSVELAGRAKDQINRAGAKISPLELDVLIAQHPAVAAALTVGIADEMTGERIHVLVVPRTNAKLDESELRTWIGERVEKYKRPDVIHFGAELPIGRTGKVDREALRRSIGAGHKA
jgi:acyl-CoA synthetase (AMP-forming)/AMP-acid ligase II